MRARKRLNIAIIILISLGLLVGMVVTFTPGLGVTGGERGGAPVLLVNGAPINELQVLRARQNPLFTRVTEGEVANDLQLLLLDQLIDSEVLRQAAAQTRVSGAEVRQAVNDFRAANNVAGPANDQRYLALLRNAGLTDADFRRLTEQRLREQRFIDSVIGQVSVTDEEVRLFFEVNAAAYRTEERIIARQITVADAALATELYARALAGEDFAALARQYSTQRADRDGALGAPEGSATPVPVSRAALPSAVADAAFGLGGAGLTPPINAAGLYYLIHVEELVPGSPQSFEEVEAQVRADALAVKQSGEVQRLLRTLRDGAQIVVAPESPFRFDNPVVATVGDAQITAAELVRATYGDPQIQQFLNPETASLVTLFFKPNRLAELIELELAYQGARALGQPFIGTREQIAWSALAYVSREAAATSEELDAFYQANQSRFIVPARAVVSSYSFGAAGAAKEFRGALLAASELDAEALAQLAEAHGAAVEAFGAVTPGQLPTELDSAVFRTNAFTALPGLPGRSVSDVLVVPEAVTAEAEAIAAPEEAEAITPATVNRYLVLVAVRAPERVRPLDEVRAQVEEAVLASNRLQLQRLWLDSLREQIPVVELSQPTDAVGFEVPQPEIEVPEGDPEPTGEGNVTDDEGAEPETTP